MAAGASWTARQSSSTVDVAAGDTVIVSELSRLGRSLREVLGLIEELLDQKRCRLILVKQGLDLDPQNHRDMTHKILLTIFAMLAELERDFVSERTKEGLRARREQGIVLGKPKGVVQPSMYDADRERIGRQRCRRHRGLLLRKCRGARSRRRCCAGSRARIRHRRAR